MPRNMIKAMIPRTLVQRRLPTEAGNSVLLTFDDGPTPGVTERVLDLLDQFQARAAFFVVGTQILAAPDLAAEIVRRGHVVGNHSFDHDSRYIQNPVRWWQQLHRCQEVIAANAGMTSKLYRPPESHLSHLTVFGPRLAGLQHILWSLNSEDWTCKDSDRARQIGREVADLARPRDIIVCHDFSKVVHDLLEELLPRLRDKGFDLARGVSAVPGGPKAAPVSNDRYDECFASELTGYAENTGRCLERREPA